jgi:hypothetical protein
MKIFLDAPNFDVVEHNIKLKILNMTKLRIGNVLYVANITPKFEI